MLGKGKVIAVVDWGIATNLQALSNNRLNVVNLCGLFNTYFNAQAIEWIEREFVKKGAVFIVHSSGREAFPNARTNFLDAIQTNKWPLTHSLTIKTSDGNDFFDIYTSTSIGN